MQLASSSAFLRRTARAALLGLAAATLAAGPDAVAADTESPSWPFGRADGPMGDDLDGVNGQTFSGSSLQLIARALVEAEAGENGGTVTLLVRRSGQGDSADELEIKLKLKLNDGPGGTAPGRGQGPAPHPGRGARVAGLAPGGRRPPADLLGHERRRRRDVGRTSGCWLGVVLLGGAMHPHAQKMERSLTEHVGDVLGGHASVLTHTLLAGVAAEAIGGESNADVNFGAVWTTAAWAVVLGSHVNEEHESGLPALLGVGRRSVLGDETPR